MPPLLLGLSGPSSSGKTTLARLLRRILPFHTIILHQDDFYRPESELPFREGLTDWDCAASLDLPSMVDCLAHLKASGTLPASLASKEDKNEVGPSGVSEEEIKRLEGEARTWAQEVGLLSQGGTPSAGSIGDTGASPKEADVVIVDGFLLYGKSVPQLPPLFRPKLMLRATYAAAKTRREARSGYVTIEGFWEDPPGYVDKVVWPGYVEEHGYLFEGGDVEGEVDGKKVEELGISVCPGKGQWSVGQMLGWALEEVKAALKERQRQNERR